MQAVLFGGTGLTGSCILDLLNNDPDFKSIIVVTRNIFTHSSNKISNKVIDFSDPAEIESCIKQDSIVFSCIGTTQAQVKGDKNKYMRLNANLDVKNKPVASITYSVVISQLWECLKELHI